MRPAPRLQRLMLMLAAITVAAALADAVFVLERGYCGLAPSQSGTVHRTDDER
jgi:hypothetical protein